MVTDEAVLELITTRAIEFAEHEGISGSLLTRWIDQFKSEHHSLAGKILSNIKYYNKARMRELTIEMANKVLRELSHVNQANIIFSPIKGVTSGSNAVARALNQYKKSSTGAWKVMALSDIEREKDKMTIDAIVIMDDFSGTGNSFKEWWPTVDSITNPINAQLLVGLLVMNYQAENTLSDLVDISLFSELLSEDYNIYSKESTYFDASELDIINEYCLNTKIGSDYLKGYGECGLLLSFQNGCPNNSLPILWVDKESNWESLFRRHTF